MSSDSKLTRAPHSDWLEGNGIFQRPGMLKSHAITPRGPPTKPKRSNSGSHKSERNCSNIVSQVRLQQRRKLRCVNASSNLRRRCSNNLQKNNWRRPCSRLLVPGTLIQTTLRRRNLKTLKASCAFPESASASPWNRTLRDCASWRYCPAARHKRTVACGSTIILWRWRKRAKAFKIWKVCPSPRPCPC